MAQKVNVLFVDDIDGSEATAGTVRFGLDGTAYEIDLSQENAEALRAGVRQYVEHARPVHATRNRVTQNVERRTDNAEVREWLVANGYGDELKDRGRIPDALREKHYRRIPKSGATPRTGAEIDAVADHIAAGNGRPPLPAEPASLTERIDALVGEAEGTAAPTTAAAKPPARQRRQTATGTTEKPARQVTKTATAKRQTTVKATTGKAKTGEMG